jgi:hypothetical protein
MKRYFVSVIALVVLAMVLGCSGPRPVKDSEGNASLKETTQRNMGGVVGKMYQVGIAAPANLMWYFVTFGASADCGKPLLPWYEETNLDGVSDGPTIKGDERIQAEGDKKLKAQI